MANTFTITCYGNTKTYKETQRKKNDAGVSYCYARLRWQRS